MPPETLIYVVLTIIVTTTNIIDMIMTGMHPPKIFPGIQESGAVGSPKKYLIGPEYKNTLDQQKEKTLSFST